MQAAASTISFLNAVLSYYFELLHIPFFVDLKLDLVIILLYTHLHSHCSGVIWVGAQIIPNVNPWGLVQRCSMTCSPDSLSFIEQSGMLKQRSLLDRHVKSFWHEHNRCKIRMIRRCNILHRTQRLELSHYYCRCLYMWVQIESKLSNLGLYSFKN